MEQTVVTIDPNVRVRGGQTYAGFEDVAGDVVVGSVVDVVEPESRLSGLGVVTDIDYVSQLVYLRVPWNDLRVAEDGATGSSSGLLHVMECLSAIDPAPWVLSSPSCRGALRWAPEALLTVVPVPGFHLRICNARGVYLGADEMLSCAT